MAVQIAKNKFTPDGNPEAVKRDYVYGVETLARYADIIVVNGMSRLCQWQLSVSAKTVHEVSSPNTPGLRDLQHVNKLTSILSDIVAAAQKTDRKTTPPVMVKVSPDEDSDSQVAGICEAIKQSGCAGLIVGNTTLQRPNPLPAGYTLPEREAALMLEQGGYSGPQLYQRTVALVKRYRRILDADNEPAPRPTIRQPKSAPNSPPSDLLNGSKALPDNADAEVASQIQATTERDSAHLKPSTPSEDEASKSRPLLRLPSETAPHRPRHLPHYPTQRPHQTGRLPSHHLHTSTSCPLHHLRLRRVVLPLPCLLLLRLLLLLHPHLPQIQPWGPLLSHQPLGQRTRQ